MLFCKFSHAWNRQLAHEIMFSLVNWNPSYLHDLWISVHVWCSAEVSEIHRDVMISNLIPTSSIHGHHFLSLKPSPISSFHKNTSPSLLSKSSHLTTLVLSSAGILGTPLPHSIHHPPSLSLTSPSTSLIFLLFVSCRNTGDPVGIQDIL